MDNLPWLMGSLGTMVEDVIVRLALSPPFPTSTDSFLDLCAVPHVRGLFYRCCRRGRRRRRGGTSWLRPCPFHVRIILVVPFQRYVRRGPYRIVVPRVSVLAFLDHNSIPFIPPSRVHAIQWIFFRSAIMSTPAAPLLYLYIGYIETCAIHTIQNRMSIGFLINKNKKVLIHLTITNYVRLPVPSHPLLSSHL